ncbi:hypothetical protein M758_5G030100, partial [Ceratodon purpureus]
FNSLTLIFSLLVKCAETSAKAGVFLYRQHQSFLATSNYVQEEQASPITKLRMSNAHQSRPSRKAKWSRHDATRRNHSTRPRSRSLLNLRATSNRPPTPGRQNKVTDPPT